MQIKVGFKNYEILKPLEIIQVGGEFNGIHNYQENTISIADKIAQQDKNHVFIHELLHAICARFHLTELNRDEQTIDLLATGIYEAIKDNPDIFKMENI